MPSIDNPLIESLGSANYCLRHSHRGPYGHIRPEPGSSIKAIFLFSESHQWATLFCSQSYQERIAHFFRQRAFSFSWRVAAEKDELAMFNLFDPFDVEEFFLALPKIFLAQVHLGYRR